MADKILFANIVKSTLAAGITDVATSLAVQAGHGTKFPSPIAGEYFKLKLKDASGNYEITHCTSRSVDTLTIVRGREGTTAKAFAAGDKVEIVVTKDTLDTFPQRGVAETIDGDKTFSGLASFTGKTKFAIGIGPDYKNNYGLSVSVASKALTCALVGNDGANPSATNPVEITFRSGAATTGISVTLSVVGALSIVSPSGATHGFTASQTGYLYYYALRNGSTVELAVSGSNKWDEGTLQSTTAISAAADSAGVLYSTTARSNVPIRYLGRIKIQTGAVAGEWDNEDTEVTVHALGFFNVELTGSPKADTPAVTADSTEVVTAEWVRNRIGEPSDDLSIFKAGGVNLPQGATRYLKCVGGTATATEADANVPIGLPTEFYGMKIYLSEAIASAESIQVKVRKDGVDTVLVTTINGPTTAGAVVNVNAPSRLVFGKKADGTLNKISVAVVTSAAFGTTNDIAVSLLARVPDSNNKPASNLSLGAPATGASTWTGGGEFKTAVFAAASLAGAATTGAFPVPNHVLQKFDQSLSTAWPYYDGTQVTGNYNLSTNIGGRVALIEETANLEFEGYMVFSDLECGNDKGVWAPLIFYSVQQAQNTTLFMGGIGNGANATEASVKVPVPAGTALRMHARSHDAIPAGESCVITVRKNGVATALAVTLNDANQYGTDLVDSVVFADNDLISVSCVSSASAGTHTYSVSLELIKNTA